MTDDAYDDEEIECRPDCSNRTCLGDCEEGRVAECGRWDNGRLMRFCTKAGSEDCDECPMQWNR